MISFITIWIVWVLYISFWVPRVVSALEFHDIKGSFCKKILSLKPHILDSYGVSYSLFWSPKKTPKLWSQSSSPRTSRGSHLGPRGAAP